MVPRLQLEEQLTHLMMQCVQCVQCVQCDTVSEAQCGNGKPHSRTAEACIHRVDGLTWLHKCPLIDVQKDVQKDVQSKVQQHSSTFIYMIEISQHSQLRSVSLASAFLAVDQKVSGLRFCCQNKDAIHCYP